MSDTLPRIQMIPVDRLYPAEWNPREIEDNRFGNLCRSITEDPGYMQLRPVLARLNGEIFAGNMRFRACVHMKWTHVPAILVDIGEEEAKRRALKDNRNWGEWDSQMLAEIIYEIHESEQDTSTLGFSEREISELLGSVSGAGEEREPGTPPRHCPTCKQPIPEEGLYDA